MTAPAVADVTRAAPAGRPTPDDLIAVVASGFPYSGMAGQRTPTGVRLLLPDDGIAIDADPQPDRSWTARIHRIAPAAHDLARDPALFRLAAEVWFGDPRDPSWSVTIHPDQPDWTSRAPGLADQLADPARAAAWALIRAAEGARRGPNDLDTWLDQSAEHERGTAEAREWNDWARTSADRRRALANEGHAAGVWLRDAKGCPGRRGRRRAG